MVKKILVVLACLFTVGLLYSFGNQIIDSLKVSQRLRAETEELIGLQKKNEELKNKLTEVQSLGFLEKQARDKLNLARPNETIMVVPKEQLDKVLGVMEEKKQEVQAYWQGWLKLFIK